MDRRKTEAKNHLKNLQDECKLTVELLNKLLTTCSSHVDVLDSLSRMDSKYYLAITQFQYHCLQKLLEINLNLEQFITEEKPPDLPISNDQTRCSPTNLSTEKPTASTPESLQLEIESQNNSMQQTKLDIINSYLDNINENYDVKENVAVNDCTESATSSEYFYCLSNANDVKSTESMFDEPVTEEKQSCSRNVVDVLKVLPKPTKDVVSDMPNVRLQSSDKKMSTVVKEKLVQFHSNLSDIEQNSYEEDEIEPVRELVTVEIRERPTLKVDDLCMIGCIESPSCFYVQVADENISIIDILSTQLESVTPNKCSFVSKDQAMRTLGKYCSIKLDDLWYRVEVLNWLLDQSGAKHDKVIIQLIDYGNKYTKTYKDLRPLLKEFYNIPKMAQLCHLDGLYPPNSKRNAIVEHWPDECIEGFLNICGDIEMSIFRIIHVSCTQKGNSYGIEFMNTEVETQDASVGQTLLNAKLAVALDEDFVFGNPVMINQIQSCHGLQGINSKSSRDDILDNFFSQSKNEEAGNINEAVMHYNPRDEALTCRNLRPDGTCYKGSSCKLRHIPLKDGFTRDKYPVFNKAFAEIPMPGVNEEVLLRISHIVDIQCFYAQIRNSGDDVCPQSSISNLIATMNKPETIKQYQKLRYPPGISQVVIVKHWNKFWYRGQVRSIQIPENNNDEVMVEVFVVDFGDSLIVPLSDLRVILREFLSIPFQAVECRLYNIRHNREMDREEEKRYFELRYLGQKFKAKIIAIQSHLVVLLYTMDGEDVGEILISCGYGEINDEHNFPKDNNIYLID